MKSNLLLLFAIALVSCGGEVYRQDRNEILVHSESALKQSVPAGNLMATAIKETYNLDVVLYPTRFLDEQKMAFLTKDLNGTNLEFLLDLYPDGNKDQFIIGVMRGKDIAKFIRQRIRDNQMLDLQVAGLRVNGNLHGGFLQSLVVSNEYGQALNPREYYKVAISDYFYFTGEVFPGYRYGNSLNFTFNHSFEHVSAKAGLRTYLKNIKLFPNLDDKRAQLNIYSGEYIGNKKTFELQGNAHRSPFLGKKATTSGIVTAVGVVDRFPKGLEVIIQDPKGDGVDETSDAINIYFKNEGYDIRLGDEIRITGEVVEIVGNNGLGKTSLVNATEVVTLSRENLLPAPVALGFNKREIPQKIISTYLGDLNFKPGLNLNEGIDFWESLEGMRVSFNNLQVVGFRGGQEEFESQRPKGHLSLYLRADSDQITSVTTNNGGIIIDAEEDDFNPEIIHLVSNHMTRGLSTDKVYNIGDKIPGTLVGNISFDKNIFGDGEYTFVIPKEQENLTNAFVKTKVTPLEDRPITKLIPSDDEITIGSYNLENLAANQPNRLRELGKSIALNMGCPDIINFVEIQDENGISFEDGSVALETLERLLAKLKCARKVKYELINIDPLNHAEGGQPGGNIRVAMAYNKLKVKFKQRGNAGPLSETYVLENGSLSVNPGRVYPNSEAFKRTRKSLVSEFEFKGQKIFLIGNHFNSKLGDSGRWAAMQPFVSGSEQRRMPIATKINQFVQVLLRRNPESRVLVLGDFNALMHENSMVSLKGNQLVNMMDFLPENERYTTNHNGNSQPLDYIFMSKNLNGFSPEFEVLNFNSDFMGRLSDHDPVIARFKF